MPTLLPRLNVTVTREQHALLLELASLDPDTPSAASFIRALIDQVTPLLRVTVPAMRKAAEAHGDARQELRGMVDEIQSLIRQRDLLDAPAASGAAAASDSEAGRAKPRARRRK